MKNIVCGVFLSLKDSVLSVFIPIHSLKSSFTDSKMHHFLPCSPSGTSVSLLEWVPLSLEPHGPLRDTCRAVLAEEEMAGICRMLVENGLRSIRRLRAAS